MNEFYNFEDLFKVTFKKEFQVFLFLIFYTYFLIK